MGSCSRVEGMITLLTAGSEYPFGALREAATILTLTAAVLVNRSCRQEKVHPEVSQNGQNGTTTLPSR